MKTSPESLLAKHFSIFLGRKSELDGDNRKRFEEIVSLLIEQLREGHSSMPVDREDIQILLNSPIVSEREKTPLILYNDHIYLNRLFSYEARLASELVSRIRTVEDCPSDINPLLEKYFGRNSGEDLQKESARLAVQKKISVISGGPGTGKTSTVANIIGILLEMNGAKYRVAMAAPTGKAAIRMQDSIQSKFHTLPIPDDLKPGYPIEGITLHRLLGVKRNSVNFIHNRENRLDWDAVVVDEASMIDLPLMSKLIEALAPQSKLILLGDKDQLSSVESGSILADIISSFPENRIVLKKTYRFDVNIKQFADDINSSNEENVLKKLRKNTNPNIKLCNDSCMDEIVRQYGRYIERIETKNPADYEFIFSLFNKFRVLCATKHGVNSVEWVNQQVEKNLRIRFQFMGEWYPGKPVMIQQNEYSMGLYNGDVGICLPDMNDQASMKVYFERGGLRYQGFSPSRLPHVETAFAMTIHKSQGSEFEEVAILLPPDINRVLSRELLYTGVTRAKKGLYLSADEEILRYTISRKTKRYGGVKQMIADQIQEDIAD